jgi:hypothetical protein
MAPRLAGSASGPDLGHEAVTPFGQTVTRGTSGTGARRYAPTNQGGHARPAGAPAPPAAPATPPPLGRTDRASRERSAQQPRARRSVQGGHAAPRGSRDSLAALRGPPGDVQRDELDEVGERPGRYDQEALRQHEGESTHGWDPRRALGVARSPWLFAGCASISLSRSAGDLSRLARPPPTASRLGAVLSWVPS